MLGLLKKHTPNILFVVIKYIYKKLPKYIIPDQDANEGDLLYMHTITSLRQFENCLCKKVILMDSFL